MSLSVRASICQGEKVEGSRVGERGEREAEGLFICACVYFLLAFMCAQALKVPALAF